MGPFLGVIVAIFCILAGNVWEGGHLVSLLGGPSALIVLGGTIGAVLVQFPPDMVKGATKAIGPLMKKSHQDPAKIIDEMVNYANLARREGILALEKLAPNASDPFLSKALMMAVDGADSNSIREAMEIVISQEEEHAEHSAKVFEAGGGYAPTVGIIGAVLGLIHTMSNLNAGIEEVGKGIAGAFVATIYGVGVANIIFLPLGGRIKMKAAEEAKMKEMMLIGILAIQEGVNPKLVRDRLSGFLAGHEGAGGETAKAAA